MAEIVWTKEAADSLEQIHNYIAQDNSDAALQVVIGIYDKIQMLSRQPQIGSQLESAIGREVREIIYGHYRIPYLVKGETHVQVLGIFHAAMDIDRFLK